MNLYVFHSKGFCFFARTKGAYPTEIVECTMKKQPLSKSNYPAPHLSVVSTIKQKVFVGWRKGHVERVGLFLRPHLIFNDEEVRKQSDPSVSFDSSSIGQGASSDPWMVLRLPVVRLCWTRELISSMGPRRFLDFRKYILAVKGCFDLENRNTLSTSVLRPC